MLKVSAWSFSASISASIDFWFAFFASSCSIRLRVASSSCARAISFSFCPSEKFLYAPFSTSHRTFSSSVAALIRSRSFVMESTACPPSVCCLVSSDSESISRASRIIFSFCLVVKSLYEPLAISHRAFSSSVTAPIRSRSRVRDSMASMAGSFFAG